MRPLVLASIAVVLGSTLPACSHVRKPEAPAAPSPAPARPALPESAPTAERGGGTYQTRPGAGAETPATVGEREAGGTAHSEPGVAGTGPRPAPAAQPSHKRASESLPPVGPEPKPVRVTVDDASDDGARAPGAFRTRYGQFVPTDFAALPNWSADELRDAWRAFLRGCRSVQSRPLWADTCSRARTLKPADSASIRHFLQTQFTAYHVQDTTGASGGLITGYYEPILSGSRQRSDRFRYPVYAVPGDMLSLDARRIPKEIKSRTVYARVDGRKVVPVPAVTGPAAGLYALNLRGARADVRDKRVRLRTDGDQLVPYYTRAQIEGGQLRSARVLAWVDNPRMLYTMHLQGVGKITLPDGEVVRVAYADQNGHPFRSKVKVKRSAGAKTVDARRVQGVASDALAPETGAADEIVAEYASVDEEFVVDVRGVQVRAHSDAQALAAVKTTPKPRASPINDPSYLFFREVPDGPEGPTGALGVPLTPGRSLAVDPRITPLGAPVFLSTQSPEDGTLMNRLVVAQDTGGAIRGPLRADYFFGAGPAAGALAHRMKHEGRMWLLLPRSFQPAANMQVAVRGEAKPECVVADDESCVEGALDEALAGQP
jgi:membrane-bound lytic murein transglycosylase A